MITKGIIESIVDEYSVKVRIPLYNKFKDSQLSTPTEELSTAVFCTVPNAVVNPRVGDIVILGFENNDIDLPIVLGYLFSKHQNTTLEGLKLSSLIVSADTKLSANTYIGKVSPAEIACLENLRGNIQSQLDNLITSMELVKQHLQMSVSSEDEV